MTTSTTSNVYIHVIEDVINKFRDEFVNTDGGPGEAVLSELQGIWEMKMMHAGVICGPIERSSAPKTTPPLGDLNMPYEGTEEYETPTADMLFPPTPQPTPSQTPLPGTTHLPGTTDNSMYNIPTGNSDYSSANDTGGISESKVGRPSPYMQPPSPWMSQRPPLSVDVNVAYVEGREEVERGASNQPLTQDFFVPPPGKRKRDDFASPYHKGGYTPKQIGAGDSASEASQRSNFFG